MTYTANKIINHLFQGGYPPEGDGLKRAGVDVLVLCARELQDADRYDDLEVILAPGDDDERLHRFLLFLPTWKDAAARVVERVKEGKNVLVTCAQGLNRSGIVVAMAVCELTRMSGQEAVDLVQRRREGALFNTTFVDHLVKNFPKKTP